MTLDLLWTASFYTRNTRFALGKGTNMKRKLGRNSDLQNSFISLKTVQL